MTRYYDSADPTKMLAFLRQPRDVMYACFGL
jgi:hypothetical protein